MSHRNEIKCFTQWVVWVTGFVNDPPLPRCLAVLLCFLPLAAATAGTHTAHSRDWHSLATPQQRTHIHTHSDSDSDTHIRTATMSWSEGADPPPLSMLYAGPPKHC